MTAPDLDALEKLADEALPYWGAVDMALGGNPIAADLVAPFAASVSPATIKALIAELKEARAALEPFAAHLVIYDANTPPMTVIPITTEYRHIRRAFLARNGKGEG